VSVGWLEFNVPFQHKYGYIRDEGESVVVERRVREGREESGQMQKGRQT